MIVQQLPILNLALLDFRDVNTLVISDLSTYLSIPVSGTYSLQITVPGYNTANVTFTPGTVNVYKCVDLGVTCSDSGCSPLPDGIYEITYTVIDPTTKQNNSINLKFIKIDTIKCNYQKAFLKVNLDCYCQDHTHSAYFQDLRKIKLYIDGSVAACNGSNYVLSYDLYTKADAMLCKLTGKYKNMRSYNGSYTNSNCNC